MRFLKLLTVTLIAGAFIAALALIPSAPCFKGGNGYTFFCGDSSKNCREITVESGAALNKYLLGKVCGECTAYDNFDLDEFLQSVGGEVVFVEELSDSVNYYCKANLPYSINLYGEEINLHVSVKTDSVKVASPIIFGGY